MTQIFEIHCIKGLPNISSIKNILSSDNTGILSSRSDNTDILSSDNSSIYVASDLIGAQIYIDGIEQTGIRTPAMISDLPTGNHNIKLVFPGYIGVESSIPLESGRTYNVFLTMGKQTQETSSVGIFLLIALGLGFLLFRKNVEK